MIGEMIPGTLDIPIDGLLAALLLVDSGIPTLQSASTADDTAEEERDEAQEEVERLKKDRCRSTCAIPRNSADGALWGTGSKFQVRDHTTRSCRILFACTQLGSHSSEYS